MIVKNTFLYSSSITPQNKEQKFSKVSIESSASITILQVSTKEIEKMFCDVAKITLKTFKLHYFTN
jgi:hypothetical protein